MEKLKMHSMDVVSENVSKIAVLFPNCVTEHRDANGNVVQGIDFEKLQQELSSDVIKHGEERYQFTWPGKMEAIREANAPTNCALRPDVDSSVDFENTKNLYIEGDNLEVLKLLQEDYLGKVKMIYIDPPYNTGHEFIYEDNFSESSCEFSSKAGMFDEEGNMLLQNYERNTEGNGRFHTDWLNMMYPRLRVARNLLTDDGVIFISIDENEVHNMRKITDEVFGERNFVSQLGWQKVYSPKNQARYFSNDYEFVLCYAKNLDNFHLNLLPRTAKMNARYKNPDNDPRGPWKPGDCVGSGVRSRGYYEVISPKTGKVFTVPQGKHWVYAPENMKQMIEDNKIWFGTDGNAFPSVKQYLSEVSGRRPSSLLMYEDYGHTDMAKKDVIKLFPDFEKVPFDTPKPVKLIKMLSMIGSCEDDIILDFFSGSATTAQSIFELNSETESKRRFILVQIPEPIEDNPEAIKKGLQNIAQVGEERIRRAGKKIKEESPLTTQYLDTGFRVLKLDSSNMKEVFYTPTETKTAMEQNMFDTRDNIKLDRNSLDLLFQVMLEMDITLDAKIKMEEMQGKEVFFVDDNYLIATFDENVPEELIKELAKKEPYNLVIANRSFANDSMADNFEQIFKAYSPNTNTMIL